MPREEYNRLTQLAKAAQLPELPTPDKDGNFPAAAYARTSLARKIIRGRVEAGLNQRELAKLAGMSFENLCRLEEGRHTPSVTTMVKIEQAFRQAIKATKTRKQR